HRAMASTARILDLLDTKAAVLTGSTPLPVDSLKGAIAFEDVGFAYGNGTQVLEHLSIELRAGETTAVVGSTGSGKTTLVKLLLRFYDVTAGRITLDGRDVRELRLEDLRRAIGFVSQDAFLFQ